MKKLNLRKLTANEIGALAAYGLSENCVQMLQSVARKSNHSVHGQVEIDTILHEASMWSKAISDFQYLFGGLTFYNYKANHSGLGFQLSLDLFSSNALRRNQFHPDRPLVWPIICGSDPYLNGALFINEDGEIYFSEDGNERIKVADSITSILEALTVYVDCSTRLPHLRECTISSHQVTSLRGELAKANATLTPLDDCCHLLLGIDFSVLIRKVWAVNDLFHLCLFSGVVPLRSEISEVLHNYTAEITRSKFDPVHGWVSD